MNDSVVPSSAPPIGSTRTPTRTSTCWSTGLAWTSVSPELVEQVRQRMVMPKYQAPESYSEEAFQECYDWMRDRDLIKDGIGYRDIV